MAFKAGLLSRLASSTCFFKIKTDTGSLKCQDQDQQDSGFQVEMGKNADQTN